MRQYSGPAWEFGFYRSFYFTCISIPSFESLYHHKCQPKVCRAYGWKELIWNIDLKRRSVPSIGIIKIFHGNIFKFCFMLYIVQHLWGRLVRGSRETNICFLAEPLIGIFVRQMVFLQSQLVPVESAQYTLKVAIRRNWWVICRRSRLQLIHIFFNC